MRQNTFYIPYNTQWKVVHKSDSSISFSLGKSGDCLDPIITVSPPLHYSSSNIENGGTTNYLSFRKIFPDATMRNERIDVMIQRCASNNYDTLSYIIIRKEVICQHKEQDILYVAGILVRTKTGLEKVELILDTKGSDIVMSSYLKDQLDHFVGEILKGNNFNSWE